MGNIDTKSELPNKSSFHILDYGYCRVWKRKADEKEIMEEYPIYNQSEERLRLFQNTCSLRTNHLLFVNVYHFDHQQAVNICSTSAKGSLFTERIPFRLSEFGNIKYPQIVKIMKFCIEGYKILYENFGAFVVRSTMIGFTQDFRVKVWFHTDFSQPEPQNPNCKSVQDMFVSLINAVESTCQQLYYNCPKFSQFIVKTNYNYFSKDFDMLMQGLKEYVHQLEIQVSGDLGHLKSYLKQPQGWEKFKVKKNYPKFLGSQVYVPSQILNVNRFTQKNIQIPKESKKKIELPPSELNKSFSTNLVKTETTNRMIFSKIQPNSQNIQPQNQKILHFSSPKNVKASLNQQVQKIEANNLSKTFHGFANNSKNPQNSQRCHNFHRINTQNSQSKKSVQKINFKKPLNEYFAEQVQGFKELSKKRLSKTNILNYPKKNIDLTIDTQNQDMSFESQFSLIEHLQVKAKNNTTQKLNYK